MVFFGKAFNQSLLVTVYSFDQVTCDVDIDGVVIVAQKVDPTLFHVLSLRS